MYKLFTLKGPSRRCGGHFFRPVHTGVFPAFLLLLLYAALWPVDPAWAQALTPIATVATNIATALQGTFATAVATIGLIGCGFLAMSGRMPWGSAIAVIGGIILIFGAAALVTEIKTAAN